MTVAGQSRRVLSLAVFWLATTGSTMAFVGCYGHNCDGGQTFFGANPGEGRLLDADTWETTPVNGPWLPFPKQQTYFFDLRDLGTDRTPDLVVPYISAQANPLAEGGNYTIGAGNLAEISGADLGRVAVHNGTCADYYIRVVVQASPRAPSQGSSGAASTQDVGAALPQADVGDANQDPRTTP